MWLRNTNFVSNQSRITRTQSGGFTSSISPLATRSLNNLEFLPSPRRIEIFMWGGGGAGGTVGGWTFGAPGGAGGAAYGFLNDTTFPISLSWFITVGGGGIVNSSSLVTGGGGIANRSGSDNRYGSGGGGYSGIFTTTPDSQFSAILIAGGGGGGGSSRAGIGNSGGSGGGLLGQDGESPYDGKLAYRGRGGTQDFGGVQASSDSDNTNFPAAALVGGTCRVNGYGGAGGGGYWGGSAGGYSEGNTMAGGAGGSGFLSSLLNGGELYTGYGQIPGNATMPLRGSAGNAGGVAGGGTAGSVVIRYPGSQVFGLGGTISFDGSFTIHTFASAGTFTFVYNRQI